MLASVKINGEVASSENEMKKVSTSVQKLYYERKHSEVLQSTWHGVNLKLRVEDENVMDNCFAPMQWWNSCPTEVVNEFYLLFFKLLKTRCY